MEDAAIFINEVIMSGFDITQSAELHAQLKNATRICLQLINSLCSLFATIEDITKMASLAAVLIYLLRLESRYADWKMLKEFLDVFHDYLSSRRACNAARGAALRAAADAHFDVMRKVEEVLEMDEKLQEARQGKTLEEALLLVPIQTTEIPIEECSEYLLMELEHSRCQCLCCLFDIELLEPRSDTSLIRSHIQPQENKQQPQAQQAPASDAATGAKPTAAAPAGTPLNAKDPASMLLISSQPQYLSSQPTNQRRKFTRVIGAKSLDTPAGNAIALWALKHLEYPINIRANKSENHSLILDLIRPRSKKSSAGISAASLWHFYNMILTGMLHTDAAKCTFRSNCAPALQSLTSSCPCSKYFSTSVCFGKVPKR